MHWIHLTEEGQLQNIIVRSQEKPQVIFKYNTHCNLSNAIFTGLQKNCCPDHVDFYFLDHSSYHHISEKVSETVHMPNGSPQILLIKNGECIFEESHAEISLEEIMNQLRVVA